MIANKNKAKTIAKHISRDCKYKFNSTTCNSNKKRNNKTCQCEYKNYYKCKNDYSWIPSTCVRQNSKYLKNIADTSVIECDKIISVMGIASTKITNTIVANLTKSCCSKKARYKIDGDILHKSVFFLYFAKM